MKRVELALDELREVVDELQELQFSISSKIYTIQAIIRRLTTSIEGNYHGKEFKVTVDSVLRKHTAVEEK